MAKLTLDELTEGVKLLTTTELDRLVDRAKLILSMRADDAMPRRGRPKGSANKAIFTSATTGARQTVEFPDTEDQR